MNKLTFNAACATTSISPSCPLNGPCSYHDTIIHTITLRLASISSHAKCHCCPHHPCEELRFSSHAMLSSPPLHHIPRVTILPIDAIRPFDTRLRHVLTCHVFHLRYLSFHFNFVHFKPHRCPSISPSCPLNGPCSHHFYQ